MSNEITAENFAEYFMGKGSPFADVGMCFKHGSSFGDKGMVEEVRELERLLNFKYPEKYLDIITDGGAFADAHFSSGWWRVQNTLDEMILWSSPLSLRPTYHTSTVDHENTLRVHESLKKQNFDHIPFGRAFRIDRQNLSEHGAMPIDEGWLYFNKQNLAVHYTDDQLAITSDIAETFMQMMHEADFIGYA